MTEYDPTKKPELEFRELHLKVLELQFKVKDLERPSYRKLSFWTSLITVSLAIVGIIGQSILSNIKNEKSELNSAKAKKEMEDALSKKAIATSEVAKAYSDLAFVTQKRDSIKNDLAKLSGVYLGVLDQLAYNTTRSQADSQQVTKTSSIAVDTSNKISDILIRNSNEALLKSSILKVYYTTSTKPKAITIDRLLRSHGVKSEYSIPNYDISYTTKNEIVYYNEPQFNYCKAVQAVLQQSGQGYFSIRLSSGPSSTIKYFKIYVVK